MHMQNMLANVALVAAELKVEVDRLKARVHVLEEKANPNRDWVEGFFKDFGNLVLDSKGTAAEMVADPPEPTDELRELMGNDALDRAHRTDDPWNGDKE